MYFDREKYEVSYNENKRSKGSLILKLSLKNMTKSIKDYSIYFLTLVLGVAIFYMFNSLDSQQAMLEVSQSTREIIKLMIGTLGFVSVFVSVVLGLLIVYANNPNIKNYFIRNNICRNSITCGSDL